MENGKAVIEDLLCLMLEGFDLAAGPYFILRAAGGALTREGRIFCFDISK